MHDGGKSHHTAGSHIISGQPHCHSGIQQKTEKILKVAKFSRDIGHTEICEDFMKKFATNTNGTVCATKSFSKFSASWIPMAQRLLHRFLLTISFDKPNGTATIAQTYFDNIFWHFDTLNGTDWHSMCHIVFWCFCWKPWYLKSKWHNDNYIDFLRQTFLTIMCVALCGNACPRDQTRQLRLVSMKKTCTGNSMKFSCAKQKQKWYMNYCQIWKKSSKSCSCGYTG